VSSSPIVVTATDLARAFEDAPHSTSDDVCITHDRRRLDTPEKLFAFLKELGNACERSGNGAPAD
jgi:hypothetical protein